MHFRSRESGKLDEAYPRWSVISEWLVVRQLDRQNIVYRSCADVGVRVSFIMKLGIIFSATIEESSLGSGLHLDIWLLF